MVGDRVDSVSSYGESELFEVVDMTDDDIGGGVSTADATAADDDDPGQLMLGIVIGLVAGTPPLPPSNPNPHLVGGVVRCILRRNMISQGVSVCVGVPVRLEKG